MTPGNMRQLRQEGAVPQGLAMPLTSDRWIQRCYSAHLISVGQFRTADGLVLLGGGALGLRCPAVRWRCESGWRGLQPVGVRVLSTLGQRRATQAGFGEIVIHLRIRWKAINI